MRNEQTRRPSNAPREVVAAFVEAVNRRDWEAVAGLVAPDFRRHAAEAGPPALSGRDALLAFLRQEAEVFADGRETVEDSITDGNKIAVRHRFSGTQTGSLGDLPPTDRHAVADYIAIYRIADGMIAEAWVAWDNLAVLRQLGHL